MLSATPAIAGHPHFGDGTGDEATYEAITGEKHDEDRITWDSFYKNKSNVFGKEAVSFLKAHLHEVKKGHAFVPAMGEGRNAIYLAKRGFNVDGADLSDVAVSHALDSAKAQHVKIKAVVADLTQYPYPSNYYDLVAVSLFYMHDLMPQFKKTIRRGGYILLYEKLDTGKAMKSESPDDFFVTRKELKAALKDFQIKVYKEYKDNDVDVVGVLARKP
jgi:nucleotide-binding universal stress UspA family protein